MDCYEVRLQKAGKPFRHWALPSSSTPRHRAGELSTLSASLASYATLFYRNEEVVFLSHPEALDSSGLIQRSGVTKNITCFNILLLGRGKSMVSETIL